MRLAFCAFLALPLVSTLAFRRPAFISTSPARRFVTPHAVSSEAEQKLDKMAETWTELHSREKEVVKTQDEKEAMKLAEDMLEAAIEFTRAKEEVEKEHASFAHEKLKKALDQEDALDAALQEAHHDAEDADSILDNYATGTLAEDREKRRELTVSEVSHRIENYAKSRLLEAREAEFLAKTEETDALEHLQQLEQKEQDLKATLEELKVLAQKKQ